MLTPDELAKSGTEHGHQCAVMQWTVLNRKHLPQTRLLYAIPNGGDRARHVGAAMKAEGVKRGVPDLMLPVPVGLYHGLYIEMKIPGRERTKDGGRHAEQVTWCRDLIEQGYAVVVAYGWRAAVWALYMYLGNSLNMPDNGDAVMATPMAGEPRFDILS